MSHGLNEDWPKLAIANPISRTRAFEIIVIRTAASRKSPRRILLIGVLRAFHRGCRLGGPIPYRFWLAGWAGRPDTLYGGLLGYGRPAGRAMHGGCLATAGRHRRSLN